MRTRKGKEQCDLCGREEEEDNIVWYSGERFNLCKSHYRAWLRNQNWINEWHIGLGTVIFLVIFIILGIIYINSTSYICSKNPEKCVCEKGELKWVLPFNSYVHTTKYDNLLYPNNRQELLDQKGIRIIISENCTQFHLKTQSELDIDDCNKQPKRR